jgi:hypothetical protein
MPRYKAPNWPEQAPAEPEPRTPSAGPCTFRCNAKWRHAVEAYDKAFARWTENNQRGAEPQWPEIEPWAGEPVLCRKCAAVVRGALRELPLAYTALNSAKFLTRTASADEERRGRSDVPPSPSPGADHQDEILRVTTDWEDSLRQHLGHQGAHLAVDPQPLAALTAAAEYLNANYQPAIEWPECAELFADQVWQLHRTAVAMVKNKPVRRFLPVPCPSCDITALVQEEGLAGRSWYVECTERLGGCSRLFSEGEYDWLRALLTGGHVRAGVAA